MKFFNCLKIKNKKTETEIPDRLIVNWDNAFINCQRDYNLVKELFSYMVDGLQDSTSKITEEYGKSNYEDVSRLAHRIKGDSASLGCDDLMHHAHQLQMDPEESINVDNLVKSAMKTLECIHERYP